MKAGNARLIPLELRNEQFNTGNEFGRSHIGSSFRGALYNVGEADAVFREISVVLRPEPFDIKPHPRSPTSRQAQTLDDLSGTFPPGVSYVIPFDATLFVRESIKDVVQTLAIAVLLVVLVIYAFIQDWRMTLVPMITIPVSLIGTFALMKALGFSINTLTRFGLTLATGLVVDDAIVVIENIARFVQEKHMSPLHGAEEAMREISGAVIATSLVPLAVFIPVAFFPGSTGCCTSSSPSRSRARSRSRYSPR